MTEEANTSEIRLWRNGVAPHVRIATLALVYFLAAKAGLNFAVVGGTVTLVWPPSGIALAAILIFGKRMAVGVALGAFLANASTGASPAIAGAIAFGNTLEAMLGALLLRHLTDFHLALDRRRDVFALIALAAMLATALGATVGVVSLALGGEVPWPEFAPVWVKWWLGDTMGVLVVAPPLLVWRTHPRSALPPRRSVEAVALSLALLILGGEILLTPNPQGQGYFPSALAVFPFVIWAALRFGLPGATLTTLAIALLAIRGTSLGVGPFAGESPVDSLVRWCAFANVVAVTGLLLGAIGAEQRRAQTELQASHAELERRVLERTVDLARINADLKREMAERKRLEAELILSGENHKRAVGRELHDGLGQHLTSIAFFGATLGQRLEEGARSESGVALRIVELANQAIAMVRAISRGLYPVALESAGLSGALRQLADDIRVLKGIDCEFLAHPDARADDPSQAINLYRIAQEAINNALKHGRARKIRMELSVSDGHQRLTVSDDGIGIDPSRISTGTGMGLNNLRHRASLLGGTLTVEAAPTGGTTVGVTYPARGQTP